MVLAPLNRLTLLTDLHRNRADSMFVALLSFIWFVALYGLLHIVAHSFDETDIAQGAEPQVLVFRYL